MYTTDTSSCSIDTQILILTSHDFFREKLVDFLTLLPDIQAICPETFGQLTEYLHSVKCDLLFLDENIHDVYSEDMFIQLKELISSIPLVLIMQEKSKQDPLSTFSSVIGSLQVEDLSFQCVRDFIQKAKEYQQLAICQAGTSIDRDLEFQNTLQTKKEHNFFFFEKIIETTPNIIFIWDIKRNCISFVNHAVKDILGFSPEEIIEKKYEELVSLLAVDDLSGIVNHFNNVCNLKGKRVLEHEFHLRNKQNKWCWLKGHETAFLSEDDNIPIAIIGSLQNITQCKVMQQKITRQLQREEILSHLLLDFLGHASETYPQLIQTSLEKVQQLITPCSLLIYQNDGEHLIKNYEVNSSKGEISFPDSLEMSNIFDVQESLLLNKHFLFNKSAKSNPTLAETFYRLFDQQVKKGGIFPITSNNTIYGILVLIPNDLRVHLTGFDISVARTVTNILSLVIQNQQNTFNLEYSKLWSGEAIENNQEIMIVQFDTNGSVTYANDLYCKYFECSKKDVIGKLFLESTAIQDKERGRSFIQLFDQNQIIHMIETSIRLPSNDLRWQKWVCRAILNENGMVKEYQSIGQDITCRKKLEDQLFSSLHNIPAVKLSSLGDFASSVAQHIRNPLTTIIADSQILIQVLEEGHPARDSAEAILQAGWQVENVVQELNKIPITCTL
ncbi:MAG: PAS domain S-box protein [Anaerolineaceae bacterium]